MTKTSLDEKFAALREHWRPKIVATLNGQELKLAKFCGVFPWHHHEQEDELFLVWRGQMVIEFATDVWFFSRASCVWSRAALNIARWRIPKLRS